MSMTPEAAEEYIARQLGEACSSCGTSNEACLRKLLVQGSPDPCCSLCHRIDTHRADELTRAAERRAAFPPTVEVDRAELAALAARITDTADESELREIAQSLSRLAYPQEKCT